jgi:NADH dehydrogenase
MNVLVVGATGDVGSETAKFLVEKGHRVRAMVRSTSNRDKLGAAKDKVEFVEGDMLDKASLEPAMEGMEGLVIAIRLTEGERKKGLKYEDVEGRGVLNVVEAAKKKGIKKILLVTAAGVHGKCLSDMYQTKHQTEEAVKASGMDYTIFKPSGMFKDFEFFHIPAVIQMGETNKWPRGPIDTRMCPVSHIDLAQCMADSITNPKASNKSLEIGGPECVTTAELLNMIAKEAGINANYTEGVSKKQLIEMVKANPQGSFFTAEQLEDFIGDNVIDHAPIKEIFGLEFEKVSDFMKKAVPQVKAAMAKQQK